MRAAAYYAAEFPAESTGAQETNCVVESATTPAPARGGQAFGGAQLPRSFRALDFPTDRPILHRYSIESEGGCGHEPDSAVYTIRAFDGDSISHEMRLGSDGDNLLVRLPGASGRGARP